MVACTPHPGLGTIAIERAAIVRVVDLATCRVAAETPAPPAAGPRFTGGSLVFRGHVLARVQHKGDSIEAEGVSPLGRWVVYAPDRYGSVSGALDGLLHRIVPATGGASRPLAAGLVYSDYRTWCDASTLVMTVGISRMAVDNKRLILFHAPAWKGRNLFRGAVARVFGSVECAPDGNSVAVQETAQSTNGAYRHPRWSLWRVPLPGGAQTQLTSPPAGSEDDSPHWSPDAHTLYFVRAHNGNGWLYALHDGKLVGPLLPLGHTGGYFGHTQWRYSVRR